MVRRSANPWELEDKSGLVSLSEDDPRRLFISTSGPPRVKKQIPVLVFFNGGGTPVAMHVRLQQLLSSFVRVYFYDRAGYDASDAAPQEHPNATDIVADLVQLLKTIQVGPPYILCSWSWGALIARTFLDLYPETVHALVLGDPSTELMYELFKPSMPPPCFDSLSEGVDWVALTNLREESKLTDKEWDRMLDALEKCATGSSKEDVRGSARALAHKHQNETAPLGNNFLSVLRCDLAAQWQKIYDEGVRLGNGSDDERTEAKEFIQFSSDYHKGLCNGQVDGLSNAVYSAHAPGMYHDCVLRKPELVAQAVYVVMRWSRNANDQGGVRENITLARYESSRNTRSQDDVDVERNERVFGALLRS